MRFHEARETALRKWRVTGAHHVVVSQSLSGSRRVFHALPADFKWINSLDYKQSGGKIEVYI